MVWFKILVIVLDVEFMVAMIAAARFHFTTHGRVPWEMKMTALASLFFFVSFLVARFYQMRHWAFWSPINDIVGTSFVALAFLVFSSALRVTRRRRLTLAFSRDLPDFICTSGPYARVRHPFYLSYLLFWSGLAIEALHVVYGFLWVLSMLIIYVIAASAEEEKFATSLHAAEYAAYRRRAGMFLPRFRRVPA